MVLSDSDGGGGSKAPIRRTSVVGHDRTLALAAEVPESRHSTEARKRTYGLPCVHTHQVRGIHSAIRASVPSESDTISPA